MPLISYEEACDMLGLTPAQCEARGLSDAATWHDASLACAGAFSGRPRLEYGCFQLCAQRGEKFDQCAAELRETREADHAELVTQAHVLGAIGVAVLVFAGYYLGQKGARKI